MKKSIVFATNNENKLREARLLLSDSFTVLSLKDIGCLVDIPETSPTIEGNAKIKANYITEHYNLDCFADDTGLLIDALNGEPGVLSARYAGSQRNSDDNIYKVLLHLENVSNRKAHFKSVIALNSNGSQKLFTGSCEGTITSERYGTEGFGYDPVFRPNGFDLTFAQMTTEQKNQIGHRGKAIKKLVAFLASH